MGLLKCSNVLVSHLNFSFLIVIFIVVLVIILLLAIRPFLTNIRFVGQNNHTDVCAAMVLNFLQPPVDVQKRFFVSKVKHDQYSVSAFVVSFSDSPVPLLASSIPYLQSHSAFIDLQSSESKVNSDGGDVILLEVIVLHN